VEEERWRQILSSLVVCFFARDIYKPEIVSDALNTVGFDLDKEDLNRIGKKIYQEKLKFKLREGFSLEELKLPERIFETPTPKGKLDEDKIKKAINYFKNEIIK
ncbi:aldehyde:ferredoxin oxidoreductase, partial [candidate division MSBL1 archaeon SCGC-AAA385D11]